MMKRSFTTVDLLITAIFAAAIPLSLAANVMQEQEEDHQVELQQLNDTWTVSSRKQLQSQWRWAEYLTSEIMKSRQKKEENLQLLTDWIAAENGLRLCNEAIEVQLIDHAKGIVGM